MEPRVARGSTKAGYCGGAGAGVVGAGLLAGGVVGAVGCSVRGAFSVTRGPVSVLAGSSSMISRATAAAARIIGTQPKPSPDLYSKGWGLDVAGRSGSTMRFGSFSKVIVGLLGAIGMYVANSCRRRTSLPDE